MPAVHQIIPLELIDTNDNTVKYQVSPLTESEAVECINGLNLEQYLQSIDANIMELNNIKASKEHTHSSGDISGVVGEDQKGEPGGIAELDDSGKVPSSQLPSYVDDVIEVATYEELPRPGESGKIYIVTETNVTYRWAGTDYAAIGSSLAIGETASTAYRGDRGKIAYDHSQATHARPDATKVERSTTNGNIKVDGAELNVYMHPATHTIADVNGLETTILGIYDRLSAVESQLAGVNAKLTEIVG